MTPDVAQTIVRELAIVLREDFEAAAGLALTAETCAKRGATREVVEIANEIDGFAHDAGRMLAVVASINRRFMPRPPSDPEYGGSGAPR